MAEFWFNTLKSYLSEPATDITISAPTGAEKVDTITISDSNNWTKTIDNLDVIDTDGNTYVYYVTEQTIDGYTATYQNGVKLDTGTGTISIINSPVTTHTNLEVIKKWNDNGIHNDNITFRVHRSTNPNDVPAVTEETTTTTTTTEETTTTTTILEETTTTTTTTTILEETTTTQQDDDIVQVDYNVTLNAENTSFEITDIKTDKIIKSITIKPDTSKLSISNEYVQIIVQIINNDTSVKTEYLGNYNWNETNVEINNINSNATKIIISKNYGTSIPILGYEITYSNSVSNATPFGFNNVALANDNTPTAPETITLTDSDFTNGYYDIQLSSTYNWQQSIRVPIANENGNTYYYWVEEINVPNGYASPQYEYDDNDNNQSNCINASQSGNGSMIITNTKIDNTSSLPMTGGTGTTKYYIIGSTIISLSIVLLVKKCKNI